MHIFMNIYIYIYVFDSVHMNLETPRTEPDGTCLTPSPRPSPSDAPSVRPEHAENPLLGMSVSYVKRSL